MNPPFDRLAAGYQRHCGTDQERRIDSCKQWAGRQDEATLYLSILTIAEYDKGISNLSDGDPRRLIFGATRDRLAERFGENLLSVSNQVMRRWSVISGTVRRAAGHPPPVIDTLLVATALHHDLCLVTRNIRDVQSSGALLFNPWEDDEPKIALAIKRSARRRLPPL